MRHLARSLAALALGVASVFAAGLPASAQDPACSDQDTGYGASGVCVVNVVEAVPLCPSGVLQMSYRVTASGTPQTTVDLRFANPGGTAVVLTGQPFSGTVNWPTSVPGRATDVTFVVGTESTVNVNPAAVAATCGSSKVLAVSNVKAAPASGVLALTGSEILPYAVGAGGLLLAGTALVLVRNRRVHQ